MKDVKYPLRVAVGILLLISGILSDTMAIFFIFDFRVIGNNLPSMIVHLIVIFALTTFAFLLLFFGVALLCKKVEVKVDDEHKNINNNSKEVIDKDDENNKEE